MAKRILCALCAVSVVALVDASYADMPLPQTRPALNELGVVGPVESAEPYYRAIHLDVVDAVDDAARADAPALPTANTTDAVKPGPVQFPLTTKLLTPGAVSPSNFRGSELFTIPVFVVGADPRSLQWIADRRIALAAMHAIGYVVEVASLAELQKIRQVAGTLPLYPIPGDGLSEELGLTHYPALLSNRGIQP